MTKDEQQKLNDELREASENGELDDVKALIKSGAEVNTKNPCEWTPLHMASNFGYLEVVKYLIEKGAEVNARDERDRTPLHLASIHGQLEVIKYLCEEAQAEVEARDTTDKTPLYLATINGRLETVKYLFLEWNALMTILGMFRYTHLFKETQKRETEAQSLFDYFLQHKHKYKPKDIKHFKMRFLQFHMSEEDSKNLKSIVKFL